MFELLKVPKSVAKSDKKKQPAKKQKAKGLAVVSEVALTEAKQMKLATKRSKKHFYISHASSSGDGVDTQSKVPDEQQQKTSESWGASDEKDDDENDFEEEADINDDDSDDNDESDDERTKIDSDKTRGPTQSSSVSFDFTRKLLNLDNPSPADNEISSLMDIIAYHATTILEITSSFTIPTLLPPLLFNPQQQEATPTPTPTTSEATVSFTSLLDFASLFKFNERVTNLKKDLSEIKQVDQYAQARSFIPIIFNRYMDNKLREAKNKAIQAYKFDSREEAQAEKKEYIELSSYEAAATLFEFELTKILIDKIEKNKSFDVVDYKRELYDALVKSYNTDKDIFESYGEVFLLKRSRDDKDKDQDPSAGSDRGTKRRKSSKDAESSRDLRSKEKKSSSPKHQSFYEYASNLTSSKDVYSRRIITVTRLKIIKKYDYGHLEEIEVYRDDQQLYTFKEGDFKRLRIQDIEDMLLLLVQQRLTNLKIDGRRKRLMCTDELHKFSDGTLNDVRSALHDIVAGIRMEYLPMRKWSNLDNKRAHVIVRDIDRKLYQMRLMRNLKKFVGRRVYKNDLRLLERTILLCHILSQLILEHQSDTKVFTMTMEILLEPTSNKLLIGRSLRIQSVKVKKLQERCVIRAFKLSYQEKYEHVGPEVTRSQDGKRSQDDDKRLCLVDDLKEFKITFISSQRPSSDTRPPMLDRTDYESWSQRIRLDTLGTTPKEGVLLGPERPRTYDDLTEYEKKRFDVDAPKAIWDNVKMLFAGSELTKEDRESQLYDEFERFKMLLGENINEYYVRFHKLINDMRNIRVTMPNIQLNSKFVNNMSPEWDRFETTVKLNKELKETNHEQLYAYLKQHKKHAAQDRLIIKRITSTTNDQLAFVSTDEILDTLTKQVALLVESFKATLPQINNQLRTSSNTQNQATVQDGRVVVQNVQGRQNQNYRNFAQGNGAVGNGGPHIRAGNVNAVQGKPIKCLNYNGLGHIARNCTQPKHEEELLFLAGEQTNNFDANVDDHPVRDLALNNDNIFQADEYDAFDSNVEPTA
nr:integrase, catalytic region, zinc finger, CCHC-type, peptidase aspartic, catalytic [Tanacetum cinerariifolium]